MDNQPILLLDTLVERGCDTQFLLQLAHYQVAMVHNDDEAFNWLVSRRESTEQAMLLLVNDFQSDMPILQLIPQIRQQGMLLPILIVARSELADCAAIAVEQEALFCCRPENTLNQIRLIASQRETV
jgi:DNA-binding NtrC family response regulator